MSTLRVDDEFRTNELSLIPGGKNVTVTFQNGKRLLYDKVKNPGKYVKAISLKNTDDGAITRVEVDGETVWKNTMSTNPWDI